MQLTYKIKKNIIKRILQNRKKSQGFDAVYAETFQLPANAGADFNNSYYFSAHHTEGQSLFLRLGLRGDNQSEIWFTYRDKDIFYTCPVERCKAEDAPIHVECLEVEKRWKVTFTGKLQSMKNQEEVKNAAFEGIFTATAPIFDFFYHANPEPMADAFTQEKWDKSFFKEVQKNNQTHYEQVGKLTGTLRIGEQSMALDLYSIRDHSFGPRDWNYMDKHIWLTALTENGDALNISMVSYPAIRGIRVGNLNKAGKTICLLQTHTSDDLINNGLGVDKFGLLCKLENGEELKITTEREAEVVYSFANGQYILREGMGNYTINGEKARGIIEFGFNKDKTRWYRDKK